MCAIFTLSVCDFVNNHIFYTINLFVTKYTETLTFNFAHIITLSGALCHFKVEETRHYNYTYVFFFPKISVYRVF